MYTVALCIRVRLRHDICISAGWNSPSNEGSILAFFNFPELHLVCHSLNSNQRCTENLYNFGLFFFDCEPPEFANINDKIAAHMWNTFCSKLLEMICWNFTLVQEGLSWLADVIRFPVFALPQGPVNFVYFYVLILSPYISVVIYCTFIAFPFSILVLLFLLFVFYLNIYVHSKIKLTKSFASAQLSSYVQSITHLEMSIVSQN